MASRTIGVRMCPATRQPTIIRRVGVDDEADVGDAGPGRHERQVGDPQLVRGRGGEVTIDEIGVPRRARVGRVVRTRLVRRAPWIPAVRISRATWSRPMSSPARRAAFHSFRAP